MQHEPHKKCESCGQVKKRRPLKKGDIIRTTYVGYEGPFIVKIIRDDDSLTNGEMVNVVRYTAGSVAYCEGQSIRIVENQPYDLIGTAV